MNPFSQYSDEPSISGMLKKWTKNVDLPLDDRDGNDTNGFDGSSMMNAIMGEASNMLDDTPQVRWNDMNELSNGAGETQSESVQRNYSVNGAEYELSVEYNHNGDVCWRGYYRNGKKYSEIWKSRTMLGYYEERNVKNGELISIAQYDDELQYKNGRCLEFAHGEWTSESFYETGMRKQLIREYRDGSIICYDESGDLADSMECDLLPNEVENTGMSTYYYFVSLLKTNGDDSLVVYDIGNGSEYGIITIGDKCYAMKWSEEENYVMEVDLKSHELRVCEDDKWEVIPQETRCIDLNVSGKRWEGSIVEDIPFGYGILYDEEGRKEYEGFVVNGLRTCYGKDYCGESERVIYEGFYYENMRFGKGILYDRDGLVDYDGLWKNNGRYSPVFDGETIDNHTESIDVLDKSIYNTKSFILPNYLYSLKRVVVDKAFSKRIRYFVLDGLKELINIGLDFNYMAGGVLPVTNDTADGVYRVANCPNLLYIQIDDGKFSDYHFFKLANLASLKTIDMGTSCFFWVHSFSLTSLTGIIH